MALGLGARTIKYCLFGFNIIFVIAGLVCLGVGIWLIADKRAVDTIDQAVNDIRVQTPGVITDYEGMPTSVRNLGIVLAAGGAIILFISFLGCCGAVKEWRPMLAAYGICLILLLGVEVAAAIYAAVNKSSFENDIKNTMATSLHGYGGTDANPNSVRTVWDSLMNSSQCCGVDPNYEDKHRGFSKSVWFSSLKQECPAFVQAFPTPYPSTCCSKDLLAKASGTVTNSVCNGFAACVDASLYPAGCYEKTKTIAESKMTIIIGVGAAVAVIQLIGIIFSFCLCCSISGAEEG